MRAPTLFSAPHDDGGTFYAQGVFKQDDPPFEGCEDEAKLAGWVKDLWEKALYAKRPEQNRLKVLELLWAGFHYNTPQLNRENEITNLAFLAVESVWPELVENRPRPEPVARRPELADKADNMAEAVDWVCDRVGFDEAHEDTTRDKLKFGWCVWLIAVDEASGMPSVTEWDPFDIYFDPSASDIKTLDHFFLATPVNVRMLKAKYPWMADDIKPDGYVSPSYDVYVRPYIENYPDRQGGRGEGYVVPSVSVYPVAAGPGSTEFSIASPGGAWMEAGSTVFLLQLYIRDYRTRRTVYEGYREIPHPSDPTQKIQVPGAYFETDDPDWGGACSESGWSVIRMLSNGKFLKPEKAGLGGCVQPVDPCYGGLPIVVGRDHRHPGRMYAQFGEIDQIASPNRHYNIRKNQLNRSLEYESTPVLKAKGPINRQFDKDSIDAGEVLELQHGSDAEWMEFHGPSQQQFELIAVGKEDAQMVGGMNDAQLGQRPTGIEAASAFRALIQQSSKRIRGKEPAALRESAEVIKKCMGVLARKYTGPIGFQARNGDWVDFDPRAFLEEWDFAFAQGSGLRSSRQEDDARWLAYFQAGAIPPIELLKRTRYPNWRQVGALMAAQAAAPSKVSTTMGEGGQK